MKGIMDNLSFDPNKNLLKKDPSVDVLNEMKRDLRFLPSTIKNPSTLSSNQVNEYNQNGYLKGVEIFDRNGIQIIRAFFDKHLLKAQERGLDSYSIMSAHTKFSDVYDIMCNEIIVGCIQDLIGKDVIGRGSHYFCKLPNDGKTVSWHQDASYWPLSPSKTLTAWLAIDDTDLTNGCMRFVEGSHLHGQLKFRSSQEWENNVLTQTVEDVEKYGKIVDVELSAGEISIHSDMLLHSSHYNSSNRRRCGLAIRYCTPDVRCLNDFGWEKDGVLVSGENTGNHWVNNSRPNKEWNGDNLN